MLLPAGLILALLLPADVQAEQKDVPEPPAAGAEEGMSLMERGARMFLEGMRREMAPAIEDLRDLTAGMGPMMRSFMDEMGPALAELLGRIDDMTAYEPPELLPNGDIIIRRKPERGPLPPPEEIDI